MKVLTWSIIIVLLIAVGLVGISYGITLSNNRFDLNKFSMVKLTSKQVELGQSINQIRINVRTAKLTFTTGNSSKIEMTHVANGQYQVKQSGNQLVIEQDDHLSHHLEIGKSPIIKITVPKPEIKEINVSQLNGTLIFNRLTTEKLIVNHYNGTTVGNSLTIAKQGVINKHNGATRLTGARFPGLKVSVKTGKFTLNGAKKASSMHTYDDHHTDQLVINSGSGQVSVSK
ncbi:DUF4097 domain-containing protein [Sporolactobacillus sp. CPB3-1]|uniref:DUF4097 domain-containing protein n=1 Tax=Sporolactobacillus mangiferae TaxID=2940498 RepID=A0ABT0MAP1_9BACL|nr:DUF4097 family beta strand repeat-containing protein [Sporolactobacillus mangiferae]MCL1631934.1 DUF4097 domain-containing protein [Sporolactobacillus mangiferae]